MHRMYITGVPLLTLVRRNDEGLKFETDVKFEEVHVGAKGGRSKCQLRHPLTVVI